MSLYIHAIARAEAPDPGGPAGIAGQPLYRIVSGPLGAFVNDYQGTAIRAERRHIAASQGVLRALQAAGIDLLPMAFGTLSASADTVAALLDRHRETLLAQLDRIEGAVEMGLRLDLEVPDPIAYLVEHTPDLRQARDRAFGRRRPPSHEDRVRLGQLCDSALRRYQETKAARLVELLSPACRAISTLPIQGDRQVVNLAMLVARGGVDEFESAVNAAAAAFEDDLAFKLNGPWPPHNFVRLELDTG